MNVTCSAVGCPILLNSTCVFYEGADLIYTHINTNDTLQEALEKIDGAFADAGLGYAFRNGLVQTAPGVPVELGGSLIQDTTIFGNYKLLLQGRIEASQLITTGGTSSQFVKGNGTLDSNTYQLAGNYITALTGDGSAIGPGSVAFTLTNVNANPGTYGSGTLVPSITVDAKGRVTNITTTAIPLPSNILVFQGDVTGSGTTGAPVTLTLATVNGYTFASNTFLKFAVNNKGLVTSAAAVTNLDIEGALGYVPVPNSRTITINGITQNLQANRTWTLPGGGTVTSVTASAPLSSTGGNTPNISIAQAGSSSDGFLSSTDWTTFNNKQTAGLYITDLTGEATATGPGVATVTLSTPAVTSKVLTGVNITGGTVVATDTILQGFGKLQNQINGLIGGSIYQGVWNAATNTPTLTSGVGTDGYYYIVNVAGNTNLNGITNWNIGDWAIFHGGVWQKVDNTDAVVSVNGYTGAVSLVSSDVPEGLTNLYFTNTRARQALSLTTTGSSGASTYDNTTGIFNIPNYNPDLSGYVPYTGATSNLDLGVNSVTAATVNSAVLQNTANYKLELSTIGIVALTNNTKTWQFNIAGELQVPGDIVAGSYAGNRVSLQTGAHLQSLRDGVVELNAGTTGTESARLTFTDAGALGLGTTPSYGTAGQVLISNGVGSAVTWANAAAGSIMVAGSGTCSSIRCGVSNTASGSYSAALGGLCNTASGACSFIGGGCANVASNISSFVGGGRSNTSSAQLSAIVNGINNTASDQLAFVGNGSSNSATGYFSAIVNGSYSTSSGYGSFIGGGQCNRACASYYGFTNVVGGKCNNAVGAYSSVLGGFNNTASAYYSGAFGCGLTNSVACSFMSNRLIATNLATAGCAVCSDANGMLVPYTAAVGSPTIYTAGSGTCSTLRCGVSNTASGNYSFAGGGQCNTASGDCSTISGGQSNIANAFYAVVAGGQCNNSSLNNAFVGGGQCNTSSGFYTAVVGGQCNTASGIYGSFVGGGRNNIASGVNSSVVGGCCNKACGSCSSVVGGKVNTASGAYSFVGGGKCNTATCGYAFIGGGLCNNVCRTGGGALSSCSAIVGGMGNTISGGYSFIGGGGGAAAFGNTVSGALSSIVGGRSNTASGAYSFIGGGQCNQVTDYKSVIVGGDNNSVLSHRSFIGAGYLNLVCGSNAFIGGGQGNTISCYSDLTSVIAGGNFNTSSGSYTAIVGGNCNTVTKGSSFIGGGDCNTVSGYFASVVGGLCNTASGKYSFIGGGQSNIACVSSPFASYPTVVGGCCNRATGGFSFVGGGYCNIANSSSSFIGGGYANTASGGYSTVSGGYCNTVSGYASVVDGGKTNAASGSYSFIGGGCNNRACGNYSTIVGGGRFGCNTASGNYSFIGGGIGSNTASGTNSVTINGYANTASAYYATILNGYCNKACCNHTFIGVGRCNTTSGTYAIVVGGKTNTASGNYSFIGGGLCNTISGNYSSNSTIGGGQYNTISNYSGNATIGGGFLNKVCNTIATVAGGERNTASGWGSAVLGGLCNTASAYASSAVGGLSNRASGCYSFVGGGRGNVACGKDSTLSGGYLNTACACRSTVSGGYGNLASGCGSAILGGKNNTASGLYSGAFGCGLTNSVACSFASNQLWACNLVGTTVAVCVGTNGLLVRGASDARLKTNICNIPYGLCDVNKLRPVSFDWNEQERDTRGCNRQVGFIAQEVEPIIPEAVGHQADNGEYSLSPDKIIPVLTKAVQELSEENTLLKARLDAIEKHLNLV
jgi:hypothetical protein